MAKGVPVAVSHVLDGEGRCRAVSSTIVGSEYGHPELERLAPTMPCVSASYLGDGATASDKRKWSRFWLDAGACDGITVRPLRSQASANERAALTPKPELRKSAKTVVLPYDQLR